MNLVWESWQAWFDDKYAAALNSRQLLIYINN